MAVVVADGEAAQAEPALDVIGGAGSIVGWGRNNDGQLNVPTGNDFVAVAAGSYIEFASYSLALKEDGSIVGWGNDGGFYDEDWGRATPPGGTGHAAIAAGYTFAAALKEDGSIVAWGENGHGQATPPPGHDYVAISAGGWHGLALRADGSIAGWGFNSACDPTLGCGDGRGIPPAGKDFQAVSAGGWHSLALKKDGSIVGWGMNGSGQADPPAGNDYVAISAYGRHNLALKADGSIVAWGENGHGQATPPPGHDYVAIAAGQDHSLTLKADGSIVGFGLDEHGQATPPSDGGFLALSAGADHNLALEVGPSGEFTALTPARVLDTRHGTGTDGVVGPLDPGGSIDVQITGRGGVPSSGVQAVVMNVTAVDPTAWNYFTVYPTGIGLPNISNLNTVSGVNKPNLVTVRVGVGGKVTLYNFDGTTHALFDVAGFYSDDHGPYGYRFRAVDPYRLADTRHGTGGIGTTPFGPGETRTVAATGVGGVPSSGVAAVALNVTVDAATAWSYLTVSPSDVPRPPVSNLNYLAGDTVANQVIVRVPTSGFVDIYNAFGQANVIVDVAGYYDDAGSQLTGRFVAWDPERDVDTRHDSDFPAPGDMWDGDYLWYGCEGDPYSATVVNVTVTGTTGGGYIVTYPFPGDPPATSTVNYGDGDTVANHAIVGCGPDMAFLNVRGTTHLIVDSFGAFT